MTDGARLLILTPVKDAAPYLDRYLQNIYDLDYPRDLISIGILEGDSSDGTYDEIHRRLPDLNADFRSVTLHKKDFGFRLPAGAQKWENRFQVQRRTILAKSRNHLLFRALDDEDWVLWLDVDVIEYPADTIQRLLATGKDIVHPNCVFHYGGDSFDLNAWRKRGKLHLHDLRREGDLVPLDSVGGTMLLVRADVHRDGLIFPAFPYGLRNPKIRKNNHWLGEIETEGFGIMASDMGVQCWGMPNFEIKHYF